MSYSAKQGHHEDVTKWRMRLKTLMHKAIQLGEIRPDKSDVILRKVFWNGLVPEPKDILGHKYMTPLTVLTNYDSLSRKWKLQRSLSRPILFNLRNQHQESAQDRCVIYVGDIL